MKASVDEARTATRSRFGIKSFSNCSRRPPSSAAMLVTPVTLIFVAAMAARTAGVKCATMTFAPPATKSAASSAAPAVHKDPAVRFLIMRYNKNVGVSVRPLPDRRSRSQVAPCLAGTVLIKYDEI